MNGRTGSVSGAFDSASGRWLVQVDADGARPASTGMFRPLNLRFIPSHNFSTQWLDEDGRVWPKNVVFSRQCAKGHALAPLSSCSPSTSRMLRLMCRLCHSFCERDGAEAAGWFMCSVAQHCCGGYAVCCSCALAPSAAPVDPVTSDDSSTLVSHQASSCWAISQLTKCTGCGAALSIMAPLHTGRISGPHVDLPVLSNVRAAVHVAQSRQLDAAAAGPRRHRPSCRRFDVVHQPHVG